jgi:transcription factor WhiB
MGLHDIHWFKHGMCSRQPWLHHLFFSWDEEEQEDAKEICSRCPVITQCLAHANANGEEGIWGGTTSREREEALVTSTFRGVLQVVELRNRQREQSHLQYAYHEPLFDIEFQQSRTLQALPMEVEELIALPSYQQAFPPPQLLSESPFYPNQMLQFEPYQVEFENPQPQTHPPHLEKDEAPLALDLSFFQNEPEYTSDLVA